MSRSGYTEDCDDNWQQIRWRGVIASTIRGKTGQAFLHEMYVALVAMPDKKLITEELAVEDGSVCAIGAVGKARGVDMSNIEPDDPPAVARAFGISEPLAQEIVWMNDEAFCGGSGQWAYTPERRYWAMRAWVVKQLKAPPVPPAGVVWA